MSALLHSVVFYLVLTAGIVSVGYMLWRMLHHSHAPIGLVFRWVITGLAVAWELVVGHNFTKAYQAGDRSAVYAVFLSAIIGIIMAMVWVPSITGLLGGLFGSLFDGGSQTEDPKPFYSIFRTKRGKGLYLEALAEVRRQLAKFPNDYEGQMLLAELQAENLADLQGAEITVNKLCAQPGRSQSEISSALNRLADWQMNIALDPDAARTALGRIIDFFPNTEMSNRAAQRIAHLAKRDQLVQPHDRKRVEIKRGVENLGLVRGANGRLRVPEIDNEKLADEYVAHLTEHPMDTEAREKLAVIYARHFHRLDLALDQLEMLIQLPGAAAKQIVHWLNVCADLQVAEGDTEENIRATLQRIVDLYPGLPVAETAQRRLDRVKLEMKATAHTKPVTLGDYEQDIGLRQKA